MAAKREATEEAQAAQQELARLKKLHSTEVADAKLLEGNLRKQIAMLEENMKEKEASWEKERGNLQRARNEMQVNIVQREATASAAAQARRREIDWKSQELEQTSGKVDGLKSSLSKARVLAATRIASMLAARSASDPNTYCRMVGEYGAG